MAAIRFTLAYDSKKAKLLKLEAKKQGRSFSNYVQILFLKDIKTETPRRKFKRRVKKSR